MDLVVSPTLFIAMGGTGTKVVDRLRRRIRQRVGTDLLPGYLEYLYVDTDFNNNPRLKDPNDGKSIGLPEADGIRLADPNGKAARELELDRALHPKGREFLASGSLGGAQGFRQIGHFSFLASSGLRELQGAITTRLEKLHQAQAEVDLEPTEGAFLRLRVQGVRTQLRVFVIASAGGGTGSSTLWDMGYFLRRCLVGQPFRQRCVTFGLVGLADLPQDDADKLVINSCGVLTELNHYLTGRGYRGAYPNSFPGDPLVPELSSDSNYAGLAKGVPYHHVYLVQPSTRKDGSLAPSKPVAAMLRLEQRMAEFMLLNLLYTAPEGKMAPVDGVLPDWVTALVADEKGARLVDIMGQTKNRRYDGAYPVDALTFGVATRELPVALHHRLGYARAIERLAKRWSSYPARRPDAGPDDLGDEAANRVLADWQTKLSLLSDDQYAQGGRTRAARAVSGNELHGDALLAAILGANDEGADDIRPEIHAAARVAPPGSERDWTAEMAVRDAQARVAGLFNQVKDLPLKGQPGWVYATLHRQAATLAGTLGPGWGEGCYPYQLCRELLEKVAFTAQSGPGAAERCAERLLSLVTAERELIRGTLAESSPASGAGPAPVVAPSAEPAKSDWLLLWWRGSVSEPTDQRALQQVVIKDANGRLFREVLRCKAEVLDEVIGALERLKVRLTWLRQYFGGWAVRAPAMDDYLPRDDAEREFVLVDEESTSRWAAMKNAPLNLKHVRLYRELMAQVGLKLPDEDDDGRPYLLVGGLPVNRRNRQTDYSYLEELEGDIYAAIGNAPDGPYALDVIDYLQKEAEVASRRFVDLHQEASVLLRFEPDMAYNQDCRFGADVDRWELIYDHDAEGVELFENLVTTTKAGHDFADRACELHTEPDSKMRSVVSLVHHRGGIATPLIAGYDVDRIRRVTVSITEKQFPPFIDERIKPPVPLKIMEEAAQLLLGGLVLGQDRVFRVEGSGLRLTYQVQENQAYRALHKDLPLEFEQAREDLARDDFVRDQLITRIRALQAPEEVGVSVVNLTAGFQNLNYHLVNRTPRCEAQQVDVWGQLGQPGNIYLSNLSYENAFGYLARFVATHGFDCVVEVEHNYAKWYRVGERLENGSAANNAGFYCKHGPDCATYIGRALPPFNQRCPHCDNTGRVKTGH